MSGAWLVIAAGDDRQHGGNDGYDDEPSAYYSWDSTVANHGKLEPGDPIALWNKKTLLGLSIIEHIETGRATKAVYKCPSCRRSGIKARKTARPLYRCGKCEAEFDDPVVEAVVVTTYRSRHDAAWVDLYGVVDGARLRRLCVSEDSQHSMRPLRWLDFLAEVTRCDPGVSLEPLESRQDRIAGGHRQATVRARLGQAQFRRSLLQSQGEVCAFVGPCPESALQAAHLYSYADLGRHEVSGGLLLRSDIHVLFDEGLLAVDPESRLIFVDASIRHFNAYGQLHGRSLSVEPTSRQWAWLKRHWNQHKPHLDGLHPGG